MVIQSGKAPGKELANCILNTVSGFVSSTFKYAYSFVYLMTWTVETIY